MTHIPILDIKGQDPIAIAKEIANSLKADATIVDIDAAFPYTGLQALKQSGLMGLLIDRQYGGMGGNHKVMAEVAQILATGCLSTSILWSMHCQQVAVLVDHAPEDVRERILTKIAQEGLYIASVTSEKGKGGHLMSAIAPLIYEDDDIILERDAPIVSGGSYADIYLITMRANNQSPPSEVALVYAERSQLEIKTCSGWNPMGMRGTYSIALSLKGRFPKSQLLHNSGGFKHIAVSTMIPVGHIAWAASWLGAATEAFRQMLNIFRNPKTRHQYNIQSELFNERLGRIRLHLDTVSAYLKMVIKEYEELRFNVGETKEQFSSASFNIRINNLKILASDNLFHAIDLLVSLSGLRYGYLKSDQIVLERTFRDLRSASLNNSNDRLLITNGKLALIDREVNLA